MKKRKNPELLQQKKVARWLREQMTVGNVLEFTAVPKHYTPFMSQINANIAAGVRRGFLDLTICLKNKLLFVEMKDTNGIVKPEQKRWIEILNSYAGVRATVAYSAQEAINYIISQMPDGILPTKKETEQERNQSRDDFAAFLEGTDKV